jgi:TonB family protein
MLWTVLAAAQVTAAAVSGERHPDVRTVFSADDYPIVALHKGEQGEVVADLLINPTGSVETCSIALSSGFLELDQATCGILYRRARFIPGKDGAGNARYDVVRTPPITWSLGSFRGRPVPPDYDLMINRAPDGVQLPVEFTVDYFVTRDGKAQDCRLTRGKLASAELLSLACQAIASEPAHTIRNREGLAVEAGKSASFRFSIDNRRTK